MKWLDFFGALVLAVAIAWGLYKIAELVVRGAMATPERGDKCPPAAKPTQVLSEPTND